MFPNQNSIFFSYIWYPFCRMLLRPADVTFLKTDYWWNLNCYYFDFAGCQKETKYSPVSCPNFKSLEFGISNETHLSVTFLPNSLNLNLTNTQVTLRRSGINKNLRPLWTSFSGANNITFQFKTDESYEVFAEDNGDGKSNFFNRQCQWNFIPQNKAVSYEGENSDS